MIIAANKICKSFGVKSVLENISFNINEGECVAVVGVNGAGKSTLFKIIEGQMTQDSGELAFEKNITIGYLSQMDDLDESITIYETMLCVFSHLIDMEGEIEELRQKMEEEGQGSLMEIIEKYDTLNEKYKELDGFQYKSRIRGILIGLGFTEEDFHRKTGTLSGGQKTRVSLGRLLLKKPSLLLLDEPTNHLDINAVSWLEDYLKSYEGTVIIISHDRYFLDKIVNKVIELELTHSKIYVGNFTDFSVQKEINREIEMKHYINQQKEIKKQEETIRLLKSFNREKSVKRARSREKLLSKMDVMDRPEPIPDNMRLSLEPNIVSGFDVMTAEGLSKVFDNVQLFSDISFKVFKGEKIALIGDNGIGKTTLFKMMLGHIKYESGKVLFGSNVNIGYYDQEHGNIDDANTLFEELSLAYPRLTNTQIRNTLAAFVFTGDDASKKVGSLSGGEKGRLSLAKIILSKANFLLLDEPTNHLDIYSKEILENAINAYSGTVLYISHDRYFINSTADKIFHFTKNGIKIYDGNYDYFLENANFDQQEEKEELVMTDAKIQRQKQKEEAALAKKTEKQIEKLEKQIEQTEIEIENINKLIEIANKNNEVEKLQELCITHENLNKNIEKYYDELDNLY